MMLWWILGGTFAVLGVLTFIIMRMPDSPIMKKKKEKRLPPPEPPKDWQGIAERLEKRVLNFEAKLQEGERTLKERDKEINAKKAELVELEQRFQQEQTWRKKEEDAFEKEKKHEKMLESELSKARDSLNEELTQRIKIEYEVKELRLLKETQGADVRHLSARNMELDRQVKSLTEESRRIKAENAVLNQKKEADQWVAKDEYTYIDKLLKQSRWEVDQFKRKFPKEMWPKSLLPKMEAVKPLAAQAAAPADPVAPRQEAPVPAPAEPAAPKAEVPVSAPVDPAVAGEVAQPASQSPATDLAPTVEPQLPVQGPVVPVVDGQPAASMPTQDPGKENVPIDPHQPQ